MKPSYWLILILLAVIGVQQVQLKSVRADFREQRALVKPLQDAVRDAGRINEGYRTALKECEDSKKRVGEQNASAADQAAERKADVQKGTEEFLQRLASPPVGCEAIRKVQVCPALMDY